MGSISGGELEQENVILTRFAHDLISTNETPESVLVSTASAFVPNPEYVVSFPPFENVKIFLKIFYC